MADCVDALKEWTGKASATVIYDSTVDEFTDDGLFAKVKRKPNIAIVGFTTDGDVFGGFYRVAVTKQNWGFVDLNLFIFSFESRGRCWTPQRFVAKKKKRSHGCVMFAKNDSCGRFVLFHGCCETVSSFWLGNEESRMWCANLSGGFEGIEDTTLTGSDFGHFTCCRLVAVWLH